MREDATVLVIGEDVDRSVSGATRGLIEEFGPRRVWNAPISEAGFAGAAVGASMVGARPVVDLMYGSFFYVAMDQVVNQAARWTFMSGGNVRLPIVFMASMGPSSSSAAQHSESPHPMLMAAAGLKVVIPSNPHDAKGLMLASIRDPNPVVFLRDAALGGTRGELPDEPFAIELGKARIRRQGDDVSVVAIGSTVPMALEAAADFEHDGISVEVIDPLTLVPLDRAAIVTSVRKTRRLVVCDNARVTGSAASEIVAIVVEEALTSLRSAPRRVAWPDAPMPFAPTLERGVVVTKDRIAHAIRQVLSPEIEP